MEKKNNFFFAPDEVQLDREFSVKPVSTINPVKPVSPIVASIKVDKIKAKAKTYKKPFINKFYSGLKIICLILLIIDFFLYGQLVFKLFY